MKISKPQLKGAGLKIPNLLCLLSLFLALAWSLSACMPTNGKTNMIKQDRAATTSQENLAQASASSERLDFLLTVDDQWRKEGHILVRLQGFNRTKTDLSGLCSFILVGESHSQSQEDWNRFSGPIHVQKDASEPTRGPTPSKLEAGQQIDLSVDLTKLKWGRVVQAVWPADDLSVAVPAGNYQLHFEISIKDGETIRIVKSNELKVSLK